MDSRTSLPGASEGTRLPAPAGTASTWPPTNSSKLTKPCNWKWERLTNYTQPQNETLTGGWGTITADASNNGSGRVWQFDGKFFF